MSIPALEFPYAAARVVTVALAVLLVILLVIIGWRAWQRSRVTPEERERLRRTWLAAAGKMGDAMLVEIRDDLVFYSYAVRGVEYTASQDVSSWRTRCPRTFRNVPAISMKYDPRNPANSIVVAEEWSGLYSPRVR